MIEKKYKYLLIDADNTLFDFNAAEENAIKETIIKMGGVYSELIGKRYHEINDAEWKKLEMGMTTREKLRVDRFCTLFRETGVLPESFAEETADNYIKILGEQSVLFQSAYDFVCGAACHYGLYIITNGTESVQHRRIEKSGLGCYFKDVFISEEIGAVKPDKSFFDIVLDKVNNKDKTAYLVIGDGVSSDIKGAYDYGIDSMWTTWGIDERKEAVKMKELHLEPTYVVRTFDEITEMLIPR